jgi:uncharacterized protein
MQQRDETVSNTSSNPCFTQILVERLSRRRLLQGGLVAAGMAMLHSPLVSGRGQRAEATGALFGFPGVPVSKEDTVVVPPGYTAEVLYAWGDPIADGPAFKADASNTTAEQAQQAGMQHDGLQFFPLPLGSQSSTRGLLAINHEYTDDGLLHGDGMEPWTADKVAKSQAAHGVSVIEVALVEGRWTVVRPSQ